MTGRHVGLIAMVALGLGACAVGPDFAPPPAPGAGRPHTGVEVLPQRAQEPSFVSSAVSKAWWNQFGPALLDDWVKEALNANPDLRAARLALERSRDVLSAETGLTWWPGVDLSLGGSRQRGLNLPGMRPPTVLYDTYGASVGASYVLDLFGGERRSLEAAGADVEATAAEYDMARIAVVANVVSGAAQLSVLAARLDCAERSQEQLRELTTLQSDDERLGGSAADAVAAARRLTARQAQALPALRSALRRQRAALAVLMGRIPEQAPAAIPFEQWKLPQSLPDDLPAAVLQARPDVARAQARLHAATARYGAAIANLYPQVQINAAWGRESYQYADLFSGPGAVWHVVGGLTQPLFRGGALEAAKRAAGADREIALASYVGTVLQALRTVADAQQALVEDAAAATAARDAATASAQVLAADEGRLQSGSRAQQLVRRDQVQWLDDEDGRIVAEGARLVDTVAYLQALSGRDVFTP